MSEKRDLIRENMRLLEQGAALMNTLSDTLFTEKALLPANQSSVGMHMRHILEFYRAFLGSRGGRIDYDKRLRSPVLETERGAAMEAFDSVCRALEGLDDLEQGVMSRNDNIGAEIKGQGFSRSTIGRELQFLFSHTVHHYAMIGMLLSHRDVQLPENFGVAPSTLIYRRDSGI